MREFTDAFKDGLVAGQAERESFLAGNAIKGVEEYPEAARWLGSEFGEDDVRNGFERGLDG